MANTPAEIQAKNLVLQSNVIDSATGKQLRELTQSSAALHQMRGMFEGEAEGTYFYVAFTCTPSASLKYDGHPNLHQAGQAETAGHEWKGEFEIRPRRRIRDAPPRHNKLSLVGTPIPKQQAEIDISITYAGWASHGSAPRQTDPTDSSHTGAGLVDLQLSP